MNQAEDHRQKFLADTKWDCLPEDQLGDCNDQERAILRAIEQAGFATEAAQLAQIVIGCTNKYQFAKTYKLLRADLHTFAADPNLVPAGAPRHVIAAGTKIGQNIIKQKLSHMALWFYVQWREPGKDGLWKTVNGRPVYSPEQAIERYAGRDPGPAQAAGCLSAVMLLALIPIGTAACWCLLA
jgi:hypothetical protein